MISTQFVKVSIDVPARCRVMVEAVELGPHDIRVNTVNPGITLTPMGDLAWSDPAVSGPVIARVPLDKFSMPIDVENTVAFLLSDLSGMIQGASVPVDGGLLIT